ncbi:MAG: DUF1565 domain-containing protein [bacterium]
MLKIFSLAMLTALTTWLYLCGHSSQTRYYVDLTSGDDRYPGTSWSLAKASIAAALDLVADGDTVCIAEGVYEEDFTLPSNVTLIGGFASGGQVRDPRTHVTIVAGSHQDVVVTILETNDLARITGNNSPQITATRKH